MIKRKKTKKSAALCLVESLTRGLSCGRGAKSDRLLELRFHFGLTQLVFTQLWRTHESRINLKAVTQSAQTAQKTRKRKTPDQEGRVLAPPMANRRLSL